MSHSPYRGSRLLLTFFMMLEAETSLMQYCPIKMKFIKSSNKNVSQSTYLPLYWLLYLLKRPIHCVVLNSSIARDRKGTCSDSFAKLTPPAALAFFGTWRRRRTTSSRSSRLVFMEKARPARRSIFAPWRSQIASLPTAQIKVSSSENKYCATWYSAEKSALGV